MDIEIIYVKSLLILATLNRLGESCSNINVGFINMILRKGWNDSNRSQNS